MKRNRFLRVLRFGVMGAVAVALAGGIVMQLWNWLMPALFGLHVVTFWQALGLFALSRFIFGGFRGGPRRFGPGFRMRERWERLTPEQRAQFLQGMRGGACEKFGPRPDAAEPKAL